jgi:predicted metalloenzyme YecM
MKKLVEQLNAEIKKAFENGDYEIAEMGIAGTYDIQFQDLKEPLTVIKWINSCTILLFQEKKRYGLLPFDIFSEKLAAFEAQNNAKQIKKLEAKLQALKGGNNE